MENKKRQRNSKCLPVFFKSMVAKIKSFFQSNESFDINDLMKSGGDGAQNIDDPYEYVSQKLAIFLTQEWSKSINWGPTNLLTPEQYKIQIDTIYKNLDIQQLIREKSRKPLRKFKNTQKSDDDQDKKEEENEEEEQQENEQLINDKIDSNKELSLDDLVKQINSNDSDSNNKENFYQIKRFVKSMIKNILQKQQLINELKYTDEQQFTRIRTCAKKITQLQQQQLQQDTLSKNHTPFFAELLGSQQNFDSNEFYLYIEKGDMDLSKYIQRLRSQKIGFTDPQRHITYIFKTLVSSVFQLYSQGFYHLDISPQNIGLFNYEQESQVSDQYRVKIQNFDQVYQISELQISEELKEKFKIQDFQNEKQTLNYMLLQVAKCVMFTALGITLGNVTFEQDDLVQQFMKNCKSAYDTKIINALNLLVNDNQSKELTENQIINQLPPYFSKCNCEKINFTQQGATLLSCRCQVPQYILDNKGIIKNYMKLQNQQIMEELTKNSLENIIEIFNYQYKVGNFTVCKEIAVLFEKQQTKYLENIEEQSNSSQFLMNMAHFFAEQLNNLSFSKKCYQKSYEMYQSQMSTCQNSNIYLKYIEQMSELIVYYDNDINPKTNPVLLVQERQLVFKGISNILYVLAELYQEDKISAINTAQVLYNIVQLVPITKYDLYTYIWEILLNLERIMEDIFAQAVANQKIAISLSYVSAYNQKQQKLGNYLEKVQDMLKESLDLYQKVIDSQDKEFKNLCLQNMSQIYVYLAEIYRKTNQVERCNPTARKQIQLVYKNPELLFQMDLIIYQFATNQKANQTQQSIRNQLLEYLKMYEDRKNKKIIGKYPDIIYPVGKYLELLIGYTYYVEKDFSNAKIYFDKFHKYITNDQPVKIDNVDNIKSNTEKLQWKSYIYYLKYMAQTYYELKDFKKALQVYQFYIQQFNNHKPNWVVYKFSQSNDSNYFNIGPEQTVNDLATLVKYSREIKGSYQFRMIGECMSIIFQTIFQEKNRISDDQVKIVLKEYFAHIKLILTQKKENLKFKNLWEMCQLYQDKYDSAQKTGNQVLRQNEKFFSKISEYVIRSFPNISQQALKEMDSYKEISFEENVFESEVFSDKLFLINLIVEIATIHCKEGNYLSAFKAYNSIEVQTQKEEIQYPKIQFVQFKSIECYFKHTQNQKVAQKQGAKEVGNQVYRQVEALKQKLPKEHLLLSECDRLQNEIKSYYQLQ